MAKAAKNKEQTMLEYVKTEEVSPWAKKVIADLNASAPQFKSKAEAVESFSAELNAIAQKRSVSVNELLELAEKSPVNNEDFDRAIELSSLIYSFKNL